MIIYIIIKILSYVNMYDYLRCYWLKNSTLHSSVCVFCGFFAELAHGIWKISGGKKLLN